MKTVKWGILGLGKIAQYFVEDLLKVDNAELYAVASRSLTKAEEFSNNFQAKKAYGSYEELYKDDNVDVIYIATPHAFHYQNALDAIKSKKAVLCEKPIALNAIQAQEMIEAARTHNVFFMEAIWTNFMPHLDKTLEISSEKRYGDIKHINAEFCFKANYDPKGRLFNPLLGGGALLDIGMYPVFLSLKLLGIPKEIKATQKQAKTGVDMETSIQFIYPNGATAILFCSFDKTTPSEAIIEFENATVKLHSRFHQTDEMSINYNGSVEYFNFNYRHRGYNFEIQHVQDCLSKGLTESPKLTLDFSLSLMKILDEIKTIAEASPLS